MRLRRPSVLLVPLGLALGSLLVSGCGGASAPPDDVEPEPVRTTAGAPDWEERAGAAVDAIALEEAAFAESGVEELTAQGVHIRSQPEVGEAYGVIVACAGTGAVKVTIGGGTPESVPCDAVAVKSRVPSATEELTLAITGTGGARGAVAWRIESVAVDEDDTADPAADLDDDDPDHPVVRTPRRSAAPSGRKVRR
ncbi:hypothetical protein HHL19_10985 [Streptomyces sp. R302]|uniref:hypothetical protein n=1 Tax=unclassified Streptomyces TaxID=2593676 RepID=UPI00145E1586|nr:MULTISPECIES: hypothetical protein [unclassified Streptomyces]NML50186.1 hypothetical protein [Streptomyces sp. R301]NML79177.1 hypothetical protein [Streptomyces sp. R302]